MKVGFIGTGHIAAPMARALARAGHRVTVSERSTTISRTLAAEGLGIRVAPNQEVVDAADIVFLCLRPDVWRGPVAALRFRPGQRIVSVMAAVPVAEISAVTGVSDVSVTIPIGFIENGGCPLPVWPGPEPLASLFGDANPVIPVTSEAALNHHFAASTLLSAVLGVMEAGAGWLGDVAGDPDGAEQYVSHLITGFLRDLDKDRAGRIRAAKYDLATPGTLNLQMVERLEAAGLPEALQQTLGAISASMED